MESNYKYTVLEKNEKEPLLTKIEKSGQTYEFTLMDVKNNILYSRQKIREIGQVWRINEATKTNIKRTHPHIAAMSDEDLTAAYLYRQAVGSATEAQAKIQEFMDEMTADELALKQSIEQNGIVVPESDLAELNEKPEEVIPPVDPVEAPNEQA